MDGLVTVRHVPSEDVIKQIMLNVHHAEYFGGLRVVGDHRPSVCVHDLRRRARNLARILRQIERDYAGNEYYREELAVLEAKLAVEWKYFLHAMEELAHCMKHAHEYASEAMTLCKMQSLLAACPGGA